MVTRRWNPLTGASGVITTPVAGRPGGIGWRLGVESCDALVEVADRLGADATWLEMVESAGELFVPGASTRPGRRSDLTTRPSPRREPAVDGGVRANRHAGPGTVDHGSVVVIRPPPPRHPATLGNRDPMTTDRFDPIRRRFRDLHGTQADTFVLPNPWDVGSARILEAMGFVALATTSSGFAATLGRHDQHVTRDELVAHVAAISAAVDIPVNVDAENGYADDPGGVAATVERLAGAGAAGLSIEDFSPTAGAVEPLAAAIERIEVAAHACHGHGLVLTARAENHLYGAGDLDDTISRLLAYRDAGADVVYAPGLSSLDDIGRVVREVGLPVNVLALPTGPSVPELAAIGVRRVSTGGALAWAAYGALAAGARELLEDGTSTYATTTRLPGSIRAAAFAERDAG